MITIEQCRAARGLLDWTQQDLADASGLSKTAINNFEKGHSDIKNESLRALRMAFEASDIEFMDDGLRRRRETTRILKGQNAISDLLTDIDETLKDKGGEVLLACFDNSLKSRISPDNLQDHMNKMKKLGITARFAGLGETPSLLEPLQVEARTLPADIARSCQAFAIYNSKIAVELWNGGMILVLSSPEAADKERERFEHLWNNAQTASKTSASATNRS